jgi:hypothetical protein
MALFKLILAFLISSSGSDTIYQSQAPWRFEMIFFGKEMYHSASFQHKDTELEELVTYPHKQNLAERKNQKVNKG